MASSSSSWLRLAGRKNLPRIPKWAVGVAVATPVAATLQGCLMLQEYRRKHGHAPFPVSPSRGLVVVSSTQESSNTQKPLRLLVVGDSLAVGVGTSQSGTPVLPQSIAKGLSGASGGRAVHWTCIGTPGASASQIVRDLAEYEEPPPSLLEQKWLEWQLARRRAQEWWQHRHDNNEEENKEEKKKIGPVKQWWLRVRKDVDELKTALNVKKEDVVLERRLTRRMTVLDPDLVGPYDIAVVLTGINDIKDAFLPFMMKNKNASYEKSGSSSTRDKLVGIIHALQGKMELDLSNKQASSVATSPAQSASRGPMVVFPAMPASASSLTQYPPLSWFLVPLIQMMDGNKQFLAERFPGLVLYVDPPSPSDFRDIEAGRGEVHDSRSAEHVLLQWTDVTQRAKEKVEELMSKHYGKSVSEMEDEKDEPLVYSQNCQDHQLVEYNDTPGSTLLSPDRLHPNDAGYDFWGRHIAAAIVKEWNKDNDR